MRPTCQLLDESGVEQVLEQTFEILLKIGIKVRNPRVIELLSDAGARIHEGRAYIPEALVLRTLATAPHHFYLHDRSGGRAVEYAAGHVHFDPGSCCPKILDFGEHEPREAQSEDSIKLIKLVEMLPQYAAQSTALVCSDVPAEISDIHRLWLVLRYSNKPIVTGAFSAETMPTMLAMLGADSGDAQQLRNRPRAVFDVCPSSPLSWSEFPADNLVDLARAGVPAEIVPAPIAGATSPVTLMGTVVQHAAECLGGIVIHQLAQPGAPVVWGGAPAILDMRTGASPWGAVESTMLAIACAQIGMRLGLPTHTYLATTDSKALDAQAGLESGISAMLGAMAGISMISGAGMMASLSCQSLEKLVLDAEIIAMTERMMRGINIRPDLPALEIIEQAAHDDGFLKTESTRRYFREEQFLPSEVIDREAVRVPGSTADATARAHAMVDQLLGNYKPINIAAEVEQRWDEIMRSQTTALAT